MASAAGVLSTTLATLVEPSRVTARPHMPPPQAVPPLFGPMAAAAVTATLFAANAALAASRHAMLRRTIFFMVLLSSGTIRFSRNFGLLGLSAWRRSAKWRVSVRGAVRRVSSGLLAPDRWYINIATLVLQVRNLGRSSFPGDRFLAVLKVLGSTLCRDKAGGKPAVFSEIFRAAGRQALRSAADVARSSAPSPT